MDKLIDDLRRLAEISEQRAVDLRAIAEYYKSDDYNSVFYRGVCVGQAEALEATAEWLQVIIKTHTNETL